MAPGELKLSLAFVLLSVVACVKCASLGDALLTIYTDPIVAVPEVEDDIIREKREPDALSHDRHLHHHHHHHHGGGGEEYYSKPSVCNKCGGGGGGGGPVATFAQSSAGTISGGGGHGGHGGPGSQSVSQSAAYNFGPFSASFSASQSNAGGYGGFF